MRVKMRRGGKNGCADLKQMVYRMIDVVAAPHARSWTQDQPPPARVFLLRLSRTYQVGIAEHFPELVTTLNSLNAQHALQVFGAGTEAELDHLPHVALPAECRRVPVMTPPLGVVKVKVRHGPDPNDDAERSQLTSDREFKPQLTDHAECGEEMLST